MKKIFLISLILFATSNIILAEDVDPPDWRTSGMPGLTFEMWQFYTPDNPTPPDFASNVYGGALIDIAGGEWTNGLPNPEIGGLPVSGWYFPFEDNGIVISIPNDPSDREYKIIRLQITSSKAPNSENTTITGNPPLTTNYMTHAAAYQHGGTPWHTYVYDYRIEPNPHSENIIVNFPADTIVEEIVVDTWCLPEPSLILAFLTLQFYFFLRK